MGHTTMICVVVEDRNSMGHTSICVVVEDRNSVGHTTMI